eukprot:262588-Hanusia_phi.AAC.1
MVGIQVARPYHPKQIPIHTRARRRERVRRRGCQSCRIRSTSLSLLWSSEMALILTPCTSSPPTLALLKRLMCATTLDASLVFPRTSRKRGLSLMTVMRESEQARAGSEHASAKSRHPKEGMIAQASPATMMLPIIHESATTVIAMPRDAEGTSSAG